MSVQVGIRIVRGVLGGRGLAAFRKEIRTMATKDQHDFSVDLEKHRADGTVDVFYDEWATKYDNVLQTGGYEDYLGYSSALLGKRLNTATAKILDAACGTGLGGIALNKAGFKNIDGFDPVKVQLVKAADKKVYGDLKVGRISETEKMPYADNSYDAITCFGSVVKGHIDPVDAVREFTRATKPGGYCIFNIPFDIKNESGFMDVLGKAMKEEKCQLKLVEERFYYKKDGVDKTTFVCLIQVV